MSSTALERAPQNGDVVVFPGGTPSEIIAGAAEVATQFADVVRTQRMSRRIGQSEHIQIEAWQTAGALTGVFADEGEVIEIPWPPMAELRDEPPVPGAEPRSRDSDRWRDWKTDDVIRREWELHRNLLRARALGRTFGFKARFRAAKNGAPVGWGEGRCLRTEASKVLQEDYALASMAQTRAQSRALGAPLKFMVKLAGFETTPAEEMDGVASVAPTASPSPPTAPWGPEASLEEMQQAANLVRAIAAPLDVDGERFILAMGEHFNGVPQSCVTMLRGLARFIRAAQESAPPPPPSDPGFHLSDYAEAEQPVGPPDDVVYPPAEAGGNRFQGD